MRSASCYTNKVKVVSYAKNKKVDYPKHIAKNWETLQATLPCNPDFTVQDYVIVNCKKVCTGPTGPIEDIGSTGPTGPACEDFYPTYGYLVYESHLDVYPFGPVYFWCTSAGTVESPPVPAPDYNGTTATRCDQSYTVLGVL